jgi:hypothetical protein
MRIKNKMEENLMMKSLITKERLAELKMDLPKRKEKTEKEMNEPSCCL